MTLNRREARLRFAVTGAEGAGKTSIVARLSEGAPSPYGLPAGVLVHRSFEAERRSFTVADCPGGVHTIHAAINAVALSDSLVVVTGVVEGVTESVRRLLEVASLARTPKIIFAVNKLDRVDYDRAAFVAVARQLRDAADELGIEAVETVPLSAAEDENISKVSIAMPWYDGGSLLDVLESLPSGGDAVGFSGRFFVHDGSGQRCAGRVLSGAFRVGGGVVRLPELERATVTSVSERGGLVHLELSRSVRTARGDVLVLAEA